jgi:hypothetical protein
MTKQKEYDMENTPMTKIMEKYNEIHVEMEHTIATAQYENLKPRLSTTVSDWHDVGGVLKLMRKILAGEHTSVKSNMTKE